ncbi:hypothetical protein AMTRI_Chr09g35330 [Amborella trichopoda]
MKGKMKLSAMAIALAWLLFLDSTKAATVSSPSQSPATAPDYVNLTELLSIAGSFLLFLEKLPKPGQQQTFSSLKKLSLSNLTSDQLKSLMLYHAIPKCHSLAEFKNLSEQGPTSTFAGWWSHTFITVYTTRPVAIYQVNRVLLPEVIFEKAAPLAPAPPDAYSSHTLANVSPSGSQENFLFPKSSSFSSANASTSRSVAIAVVFSPVVAFDLLISTGENMLYDKEIQIGNKL